MRRAWLLMLIGCGRIGFGELPGPSGDGGAEGVPVDGFSHVVAYGHQTCGIAKQRAYCWGSNQDGQLGDGTTMPRGSPQEVLVPGGAVTAIAPGEDHGCAIVEGDLYCFGAAFDPTPMKIATPRRATAVSAGNEFTCTLADEVLCFGANNVGQLGDGTMAPHAAPQSIAATGPFVAIRAGDDHACALNSQNVAVCWGHNDDGALGFGGFAPTQQLAPVAVSGNIRVLPALAGWHACALQDSRVQCWGRNIEGELGIGNNDRQAAPTVVPNLENVRLLATGGGPTDFDATCVVIGDNDVRCWGAGEFGRLGNGQSGAFNTPIRMTTLPAGRIVELAIGYDHACALDATGDLRCWGRGDLGQLGDGNMTSSLTPVLVIAP